MGMKDITKPRRSFILMNKILPKGTAQKHFIFVIEADTEADAFRIAGISSENRKYVDVRTEEY